MTRFGFQIPNFTFPGLGPDAMFGRVADLAAAAESSGWESVWVMDHFFQLPPLGGPSQPMLEAYTLLGAIAARTSTVELGALVTGVTYRNPAILAKQATTLDVISGGRAILGIGAAWYEEEHVALGVDFPPVRERFERLEEAVEICRAMFTNGPTPVSFDGRHYRLQEAVNIPAPIRAGGPPIMIGGGGEKKTLRLVAKYADLCNVSGDDDTIRHKFGVLDQHCADLGRDPAQITRTTLGTLILTETSAEGAQLREAIGIPGLIAGTEDEVAEAARAKAATGADVLLFNLPMADPAGVERAGKLLFEALG